MVTIALGALLPGVLCAILLLALRAWRPEAVRHLAWATPLAVGVGFVVAQTLVDGAPRIPPIEASGWFSIVAVVLTVVAIVLRPRVSSTVWAIISSLAAFAVVLVIAYPLIGNAWSVGTSVLWIAGMTVVAATVLVLVDRHASPGPGAPVVFLIAATGVAASLAACGSARYGQLGGTVASVMGPLAILGFIRRDVKIVLGAAWVAYLLLAMLVVAGVVYVDVPVFVGLLAAVAPLGMLAGDLPMLRDAAFWKRDGVRVAVTVALVAAAMGLALAAATDSTAY